MLAAGLFDARLGPKVRQQLPQFVISSSWGMLCNQLLPLMTKVDLLEMVEYLGEIQIRGAGVWGEGGAVGGWGVRAAGAMGEGVGAGQGGSRSSSGRRGTRRSRSREKDGRGCQEEGGTSRSRSRERGRGSGWISTAEAGTGAGVRRETLAEGRAAVGRESGRSSSGHGP